MKKILIGLVLYLNIPCLEAQFFQQGWNIRTDVLSSLPQSYSLTEKESNQILKGDIQENIRARMILGYAFKISKSLSAEVSARYIYNNESLTNLPKEQIQWDRHHHTFKGGVSLLYQTRIGIVPLIALTCMDCEGSGWGVERFCGLGAIMTVLKYTPTTLFGIGILFFINTTSKIPCIPVPIYRHVFSPRWVLNLNYPFFAMQYIPSQSNVIGAGLTVDVYNYWLQPHSVKLPERVFYRRSLVKFGLNYDHKCSSSLTLTMQAGWEYTMNGGIYKANGHHQYYKMNHPNGIYAHMGLKFQPKSKKQGNGF